jgi:hypothetical protein
MVIVFFVKTISNDGQRIKYETEINDSICEIIYDRGLSRVRFCDPSKVYYLSTNDSINNIIIDFTDKGATRVRKNKRDSIIYLEHIFVKDTLQLNFSLDDEKCLDEIVSYRRF